MNFTTMYMYIQNEYCVFEVTDITLCFRETIINLTTPLRILFDIFNQYKSLSVYRQDNKYCNIHRYNLWVVLVFDTKIYRSQCMSVGRREWFPLAVYGSGYGRGIRTICTRIPIGFHSCWTSRMILHEALCLVCRNHVGHFKEITRIPTSSFCKFSERREFHHCCISRLRQH